MGTETMSSFDECAMFCKTFGLITSLMIRRCFNKFQTEESAFPTQRTAEMLDSPACNSAEQTRKCELVSDISQAKVACKETLDSLYFLENFLQWPSEKTAKPLKLLFDRGKSTCDEFLATENVDKIIEILRDPLTKKYLTREQDGAKTSPDSEQKSSNGRNSHLEYDLDCQTYDILGEASNSEQEKIILLLSNNESTASEGLHPNGKAGCKTSVGDSIATDGVCKHVHNDRQSDERKKEVGKTQHEMKLERESARLTSQLRKILLDMETQSMKIVEMRKENSSLKEQLGTLETEHRETLSEFGRIMVERTAEKNKKRESDLFQGLFVSGKVSRESNSLSVSQNSNTTIVDEDYNSFLKNERDDSTAGSNDQVIREAEALLTNRKVKTNPREDESQNVSKPALNLVIERNCGGKTYNQAEKIMKEKARSGLASSSADESDNQGSTQASFEDAETPFSVQQDYQTDYISLSNQPPTSVATTLYNNYKLLLLTLAERLLSSEAELLKNWARQNFSIKTSQTATDVLFQLDHQQIINASELSPLKNFFESILRIDLVYIIDAFLLGDYDVLRLHQRKPEVNTNREKRLRERRRSDYTSPLNGASSHRATSPNDAQGISERRTENNDEAQTLITHFPRQTPFPSFPENQDTTNRKHTSTYEDENPLSNKCGHQKFTPHSTRFTDTMMAKGAVADGPVTGKSRLRSSNSSKSANPPVNQRRNAQTIGSNGFKLSKPRQPDTAQSNSRSPRNQVPDDDVQGNWLCSHYKRRCFVKFECCDKFWPCHRCHNNQSTCGRKKLKSRDTKKLKCANCTKVQEFGQYCRECNAKFAMYYCGLCKHLTGTDDHPYHCDKCGICRIHGDRSFHCDICGVCLDVQLRGNHKCREGSAHDECCICLEDAFTGCQILPCSHKVHKECATQMIRRGITNCPICRESFAHKLERRPMTDQKNRFGK